MARIEKARSVAIAAAVASASFAPASEAVVDVASLAAAPTQTYGVLAIAVAIVIVLLLWYAVDDGAPDDRSLKPGRREQTGSAHFGARNERTDSDRHAA